MTREDPWFVACASDEGHFVALGPYSEYEHAVEEANWEQCKNAHLVGQNVGDNVRVQCGKICIVEDYQWATEWRSEHNRHVRPQRSGAPTNALLKAYRETIEVTPP